MPAPLELVAPSPKFLTVDEAESVETELPVEISFTVPAGARTLTINVWNRFGVHVARPLYQQNPKPGRGTFSWNFQDDADIKLEPGYYIYRISIDEDSESRVIRVTE